MNLLSFCATEREETMVSAGDFRNGLTIEIEGTVYQIIEFQHVKPGKGAAFVRTKLKNVVDGGVVEKTFRPTEKYPQAHIDKREMQYLYNDGEMYNFMDNESYEQIALTEYYVELPSLTKEQKKLLDSFLKVFFISRYIL